MLNQDRSAFLVVFFSRALDQLRQFFHKIACASPFKTPNSFRNPHKNKITIPTLIVAITHLPYGGSCRCAIFENKILVNIVLFYNKPSALYLIVLLAGRTIKWKADGLILANIFFCITLKEAICIYDREQALGLSYLNLFSFISDGSRFQYTSLYISPSLSSHRRPPRPLPRLRPLLAALSFLITASCSFFHLISQ